GSVVPRFLADQEARDDADVLAARGRDAARDGVHATPGAAAIDQPQSRLGERSAERLAGAHVGVAAAWRGAAIDAYGLNLAHGVHRQPQRVEVKAEPAFLL